MNLVDPKKVERVAIIGAGTIGASWAAHFLRCGMHVQVWDPAPDGEARAAKFIADAWPALQRLGLSEGADQSRISFHADVASALAGAQFVQESAPERQGVKIALYEQFDDALPDGVIMSTSSSGLLLSELQQGRRGRERYILGHPFNPPHLIPLVEVLGGSDTDSSAVDWALDFYNAHGKKAIRLNKEVPGHLVNRIQAAVWREAIDAVASGLASVEDVDTAVAYGPGLRWALLGPHQIFSLAGGPGGMENFLEHFGPPIESWWNDMRQPALTPEVKKKLIDGVAAEAKGRSIEAIAEERDRLLVDLLEMLGRARSGA